MLVQGVMPHHALFQDISSVCPSGNALLRDISSRHFLHAPALYQSKLFFHKTRIVYILHQQASSASLKLSLWISRALSPHRPASGLPQSPLSEEILS